MRLAAVTLARDEADIIELFVRHNLALLDRLYIVDDGSTDATGEILARLRAEGLSVEVVNDGAHGDYKQGLRTTALMRHAMADEPWDFLAALDADEFIDIADRATLERELSALPPLTIGGFSVSHYFPHPSDDAADTNPLSRQTHVLDQPRGAHKVVIPGAVAAHPETLVSDGNHLVSRWQVEQPMTLLATANLAHFPVRSDAQLAAKCLVSYIRWQARADYTPSTAAHHIDGARVLADEPDLTLRSSHRLLATYISGVDGPVRIQPFVRRRGEIRFPELAHTYPYRRLLAGLDTIVERARAGTRELEAARSELAKARSPLASTVRKLRRSFMKRWIARGH